MKERRPGASRVFNDAMWLSALGAWTLDESGEPPPLGELLPVEIPIALHLAVPNLVRGREHVVVEQGHHYASLVTHDALHLHVHLTPQFVVQLGPAWTRSWLKRSCFQKVSFQAALSEYAVENIQSSVGRPPQ